MNTESRDLLAEFAKFLQKQGKSKSTVDSYGRDAAGFLEFVETNQIAFNQLLPDTLLEYQEVLQHSDKENSIRRKVIGTRQFFRFLAVHRKQPDSPFDDIPIPERRDDSPQSISSHQFESILLQLRQKDNLKSTRDAAILCLLGLEGIKATELIELEWRNLILTSKRASLSVSGSRARTISLNISTTKALKDYQKISKNQSHYKPNQHILIAFKGREGRGILEKMTRHGLKFLLYELGDSVKVPKLNTEKLRNHAIGRMLQEGLHAEDVMAHLGLRRLGNINWHINKTLQKHQTRTNH